MFATNEPPPLAAIDEQPSTICYNDYIRNNYLDISLSQQGFDRKFSQ